MFNQVVGSIDEMEIDDADASNKNSRSALDSKSKGKSKFYVGSQDLGFRRDHMEVRNLFILLTYGSPMILLTVEGNWFQVLSPMKDGVVVDWDMVENIWDHALR